MRGFRGISGCAAHALRFDRTKPHGYSATQLAAFDAAHDAASNKRAGRFAARTRSASAVTRAFVQIATQALMPRCTETYSGRGPGMEKKIRSAPTVEHVARELCEP